MIVNDNKSSTCKPVLLRTLVRLAETAPGLVVERTDVYVDIPFGAVGLYWLQQDLTLVSHHRLRQHRKDAGALHHLSGLRRSAVVRVGFSRVRATGWPIMLSRQNLAQFGRFRIPAPLWQALGQ